MRDAIEQVLDYHVLWYNPQVWCNDDVILHQKRTHLLHTVVCRDLATSCLHDVICVIKYNSTDSINDTFVTMDMTVYTFHSWWQDLRKPLYTMSMVLCTQR